MKYLVIVVASIVGFCNPAWCADSENSWRLSSADTAITVAVKEGVPVVTQLGSVEPAFNWMLAPVPETLLSSVAQNGTSLPTKWKYEGGALDPKSGQLVLRFSNAAPALELESIWRARPGRGPVEHWLTIANHSGGVITIGHQDSLVLSHLAIPSDDSLDAWSIKRGASNATLEGGTRDSQCRKKFRRDAHQRSQRWREPGTVAGAAGWCLTRTICGLGVLRHWADSLSQHSQARSASRDRPCD